MPTNERCPAGWRSINGRLLPFQGMSTLAASQRPFTFSIVITMRLRSSYGSGEALLLTD